MNYKSCLIKLSYKLAPKKLVYWVVNSQLKGIAKLLSYNINFQQRKIQSKVQLEGEEGNIEVFLEEFALIKKQNQHFFVIQKVQSNKIWLNNLLTQVVLNREVPIPDSQSQLVQDLFSFNPDPHLENWH